MSSTDTIDLKSYSDALVKLVEQASPGVIAAKTAPYRVVSGVVLRENVVAVTHHTLRQSGQITVQTWNGKQTAATILGRDPRLDLAFLKVEGDMLAALPYAESSSSKPGSIAVVLGMTMDVGPSVSLGILGAVGGSRRTWRGGQLDSFLRLDVNLYPSQSGAAVVNAEGHLIGLATPALLRHSAVAIPIATINRLADELLREGRIRHGYLGLGMQAVVIPPSLREKLNNPADAALITLTIEPDSPAEKAGFQLGDILVSLDGKSVSDTEALQEILRSGDAVGRSVKAIIVRGGNVSEMEVKIAERSHRSL